MGTCHDDDDAEALISVLQAHAKTLEQREIAQMRQGAILSRKLEAAEKELLEVRKEHQQRLAELQQQQLEKQKAETVERARQRRASAKELEHDLQQQLMSSIKREKQMEKEVRKALDEQSSIEADIRFWRCSSEELHRTFGLTSSPSRRASAGSSERLEGLQKDKAKLFAEFEAMKKTWEQLRQRRDEVDPSIPGYREEERRLSAQTEHLAAAVASAQQDAALALEQAAALSKEEAKTRKEVEALKAKSAAQDLADRSPDEVEEGVGHDNQELVYWNRKVEDKEHEVAALRRERDRLEGALSRHEGPGSPSPSVRRDLEVPVGKCGAFDETVAWLATILFKSNLVRRAFCVHMAVLYCWLLFLLWWLSVRPSH